MFSSFLVNIVLELIANTTRKKKKTVEIGKEEVKLSFAPDYMITCAENTNEFSKSY